ncbi:hypothetical protein [Borreliella burgdorferi]|uniref:hypothetical protein n=1 Tax=Borreliella burgdorferi TaxID=139 RepID=UPI0001F23971|nr:hypothetical protein [Borreliella burgdorferi]ADQ30130.1 conserved hypothetical protein [Borreliella burgdorferi N40]MCD2413747.1 hypothetical protein [Borreliella burgdorferi]PRQ90841.1 hypothetical protein CV691_05545 [Borreliella burgdorferi]PRR13703.1 hypothetical protein CV656_05865 [Borreliella burgdorferi]PRR15817.1 hypothetical protein CV649_05495 [Borreliella burgdorferi]
MPISKEVNLEEIIKQNVSKSKFAFRDNDDISNNIPNVKPIRSKMMIKQISVGLKYEYWIEFYSILDKKGLTASGFIRTLIMEYIEASKK